MKRLDEVVEGWWRSVEAEATSRSLSRCGTIASLSDFQLGGRRLYVASMVDERTSHIMHGFAAFMAFDELEVRTRLERRVGARAAATASITRGFDSSEPIAASLLSEAMCQVLTDVAADAGSMLGLGLDIMIEHRFT